MPERIWRTRRVTEALPKTYHQPIGPAISFGTGCAMTGAIAALSPRRDSNQFPTFCSNRFIGRPLYLPPLSPLGRGVGGEGMDDVSPPHPPPLSPAGRGEKCHTFGLLSFTSGSFSVG